MRYATAIRSFNEDSGNLPPGIHEASWSEFVARYGFTPHRLQLLAGLRAALDNLEAAGCRQVYINGSFITSKDHPGDFDVCWEGFGVDDRLLDPVFFDFSKGRAVQKAKFHGEFFLADLVAEPRGTRFIEFFQPRQTHT